jgi:hypothetical protein
MPYIIKKVLANVVQALTETEKQRARGNIDAAGKDNISYWHQVENLDRLVHSIDTAKTITSIGDVKLRYYFDNGGALRIAVENQRQTTIGTLEVLSDGVCDTLTSLVTASRADTNVIFNNGNSRFQHLRLIVEDSEIYDVYIQWSMAGTALFYKCPDILYQG